MATKLSKSAQPANQVYIDGKFFARDKAVVSVFDHGFLYGDGVFEGIRAYNGRVFKLTEHINRLFDSAQAICLKSPLGREAMAKVVLDTLRKNRLSEGYIRLIISRGVGEMGLDPRRCPKASVICITLPWPAMYGDKYNKGLTMMSVSVRRNASSALSPNIKSLNYLNNILGKIQANMVEADEALFLDGEGNVSEGSGDNVFIVKDGVLSTPPTINNLKGITRQTVMELAEDAGYTVKEQNLSLFDLYTADELFVTGTAAEVAPVRNLDSRVIGSGKPGRVTKDLIKRYHHLTQTSGTPIG